MSRPVKYPIHLHLRMAEEHQQVLDDAWAKSRVRAQDFIRAAIMRHKIAAAPPPPPPINTEAARLLSKMSTNINQIARRWNQYPLEGITRKEIEDLNAGLAFLAATMLGYEVGIVHVMKAGLAAIIAAGEAAEQSRGGSPAPTTPPPVKGGPT
jgi:hypothetical protein